MSKSLENHILSIVKCITTDNCSNSKYDRKIKEKKKIEKIKQKINRLKNIVKENRKETNHDITVLNKNIDDTISKVCALEIAFNNLIKKNDDKSFSISDKQYKNTNLTTLQKSLSNSFFVESGKNTFDYLVKQNIIAINAQGVLSPFTNIDGFEIGFSSNLPTSFFAITIPRLVNGIPITRIEKNTFKNKNDINNVSKYFKYLFFEDEIQGNYSGFTYLKTIDYAFLDTKNSSTNISSITIPSFVQNVVLDGVVNPTFSAFQNKYNDKNFTFTISFYTIQQSIITNLYTNYYTAPPPSILPGNDANTNKINITNYRLDTYLGKLLSARNGPDQGGATIIIYDTFAEAEKKSSKCIKIRFPSLNNTTPPPPRVYTFNDTNTTCGRGISPLILKYNKININCLQNQRLTALLWGLLYSGSAIKQGTAKNTYIFVAEMVTITNNYPYTLIQPS